MQHLYQLKQFFVVGMVNALKGDVAERKYSDDDECSFVRHIDWSLKFLLRSIVIVVYPTVMCVLSVYW